jgi:hypothetical protein
MNIEKNIIESNDLWKEIVRLKDEAYKLQKRSANLVMEVMKLTNNKIVLHTEGTRIVSYILNGETHKIGDKYGIEENKLECNQEVLRQD